MFVSILEVIQRINKEIDSKIDEPSPPHLELKTDGSFLDITYLGVTVFDLEEISDNVLWRPDEFESFLRSQVTELSASVSEVDVCATGT